MEKEGHIIKRIGSSELGNWNHKDAVRWLFQLTGAQYFAKKHSKFELQTPAFKVTVCRYKLYSVKLWKWLKISLDRYLPALFRLKVRGDQGSSCGLKHQYFSSRLISQLIHPTNESAHFGAFTGSEHNLAVRYFVRNVWCFQNSLLNLFFNGILCKRHVRSSFWKLLERYIGLL